jgi:hypothetical protein
VVGGVGCCCCAADRAVGAELLVVQHCSVHLVEQQGGSSDCSTRRGFCFWGALDQNIRSGVLVTSRVDSNKITFTTDYWQSDRWNFEFGEDFSVRMPLWFLVAMCVGISTLSWLLTGRFSLRTLLIATTLVAVVLGAIVYAVR